MPLMADENLPTPTLMKSNRRSEGAFDTNPRIGEINFHHFPELRQPIIDSLEKGRNVLSDFPDVGYMDSSGIASLVQRRQHAQGRNLRVDLVGVKDAVHKVLKPTCMDEVSTLNGSVAAGLAVI
jgi:anti-anti-sigma factor